MQQIAILKYFALVVGGAHTMGCLWWFIAQALSDTDDTTWVGQYVLEFEDDSGASTFTDNDNTKVRQEKLWL